MLQSVTALNHTVTKDDLRLEVSHSQYRRSADLLSSGHGGAGFGQRLTAGGGLHSATLDGCREIVPSARLLTLVSAHR